MKKLIYTAALVAACTATGFAQDNRSRSDTSQTRERINRKADDVKEDVNQAADRAKEKVQEEYEVSKSYQERNQLTWFQKGSIMGSASLGFGTGSGSGTYVSFSPRVGYFFQPGLVAGLRLGFDRRLSTSYRANQTGAFLRYYPFRTRISGFGGFGYNFGREYSSNIASDEKARFNSVNLEIGTMFWVRPNLGAELALENNYYDQSDPLAGRNKGGRFRFGINYFFGRPNKF
ncbi:YtxH domain-containing protein [Fibrella aquatica]|uniref:YtxH domain-containing protein n=1 Tax=Fibrella aquatica TaxID=3242487 RepID=UPI003521E66E